MDLAQKYLILYDIQSYTKVFFNEERPNIYLYRLQTDFTLLLSHKKSADFTKS